MSTSSFSPAVRAVRRKEFESFVREGVEAIPERFRSRIKNVVFLVREKPTTAQRKREGLRRGEMLFGLYEGIPHTARGDGYGAFALPDKITIFKKSIEKEASLLLDERLRGQVSAPEVTEPSSEEQETLFKDTVRRIVMDTVWHEVAHHFGLDEEEVAKRERERQKRSR